MVSKYDGSKNAMPQMSLFGLGNKAGIEHNYFFALSPGSEVRAQLGLVAEELRTAHALNGGWVASERYHLTLHHLGKFPEIRTDLVARAISAANKIQSRAFEIKLDKFMSFDSRAGKFPIVLASSTESPELKNFWQLLKNNLLAVRLGEHLMNNFTPHATLLYSRQPTKEMPLPEPIHWPVKDFVLIESLVGKSEHIELGRWPLTELCREGNQ